MPKPACSATCARAGCRTSSSSANSRSAVSIVDFVSFAHRLVIEVDGGQHLERLEQDAMRTHWLHAPGSRVIRFCNDDVMQRTDLVLEEILRVLGEGEGGEPAE